MAKDGEGRNTKGPPSVDTGLVWSAKNRTSQRRPSAECPFLCNCPTTYSMTFSQITLCALDYSEVLTEHVSRILSFRHNLKIETKEKSVYIIHIKKSTSVF